MSKENEIFHLKFKRDFFWNIAFDFDKKTNCKGEISGKNHSHNKNDTHDEAICRMSFIFKTLEDLILKLKMSGISELPKFQ